MGKLVGAWAYEPLICRNYPKYTKAMCSQHAQEVVDRIAEVIVDVGEIVV